MELTALKVADLKPFERNPRVHPDSAIEKLVTSIRAYGWTNPILVNKDNTVLAGHARIKAAEKMGVGEVPAVVLDIPDELVAAYVIADNRIQDETDWDTPALKDLLQDLDTGAFDMELTGFDETELEQLFTQYHPEEAHTDETGEAKTNKCPQCGYEW